MKKFLKGSIFIAIVIVVVIILNDIYSIKYTRYLNQWSDTSTVTNFYNEPEDSLNVLVLGTSTNASGIQPAVIWNERQITSYNLSTERQFSLAAYYLLKESLKYQHPDVVVINARWITTQYGREEDQAEIDSDNAALHLALDHMKLSEVKIQAAMDIAAQSKTQSAIDYILPLTLYHNRNDLKKNDFDFSYLSEQHDLKGSSILLNTFATVPSSIEQGSSEEPSAYDYSGIGPVYVQKMIDLCKANGIDVLLLSLPIPFWDSPSHQAVQAFAQKYGVQYLDMNTKQVSKEIGIDGENDFADEIHENIYGSYKTSSYLAKYLAENYTFDQKLSGGIAESFDNSYAVYKDYLDTYPTIGALKSIDKLDAYLSSFARPNDNIVIISAKDEFSANLSEGQKAAMHALGLQTEFNKDIYRYSYLAVLDSGNVVFEECAPSEITYEHKVTSDEYFSVVSGGIISSNISSVKLADEEYSLDLRGLNIVVYSKKLGYVIDSVNFDTHAGTDVQRD